MNSRTLLVSLALTAILTGVAFFANNSEVQAAERITEITEHNGCLPSKSSYKYCRKMTHRRGKVYCNNGRVLTAQQSEMQRKYNGNWDIETSNGQFYEFGGMDKASRACKR